MYAQESKSSTVTIYGKAARYLWQFGRSDRLDFANCERGRRSPYLGTVECDLDVYSAIEESKGQVTIYGLAARELYRFVKGSPEDSGIACFVENQVNGRKEIGCKLQGFIVETEGL